MPDLIENTFEFIGASNKKGKPFVWKATTEELLAKYNNAGSAWNKLTQLHRAEATPQGCRLTLNY